MLKKLLIFEIIIIAIFINLSNCSTIKYFLPLEFKTYPVFCNGYERRIKVIIIFNDNVEFKGLFLPNEVIWSRTEKYKFKSIMIFDEGDNILGNYPKEYLNIEREKRKEEDEFWVAYEGGLVLIPEEYHKGDRWKEYIDSIKEK